MASYIDKLLLLGVILLPIGVGLIFLIWAWARYASTELAVTNKRVIGLIERKTVESVLGRLLNYGTVVISGTGIHSAPFTGIADPLTLRRHFMTAADAMQSASGTLKSSA